MTCDVTFTVNVCFLLTEKRLTRLFSLDFSKLLIIEGVGGKIEQIYSKLHQKL